MQQGAAQGARGQQQAAASQQKAAAQQQAGAQPQQAQTTRSTTQAESKASRQSAQSENQQARTSAQTENREDWQQHQSDMQQDRQDYGSVMQEDRQDFYEDEVHGHYWHGDEDEFAAGLLTGFAIGTTMSMVAAQSMSRGSQPACMTTVPAGGVTYYRCGPNWYQKAYSGGEAAFVVVAPPPGTRVTAAWSNSRANWR